MPNGNGKNDENEMKIHGVIGSVSKAVARKSCPHVKRRLSRALRDLDANLMET